MRIIFLSHYFPPEVNAPASRTFEHCREWVKQGHEVVVVTCAPNHPKGRVYDGYKNRLYSTEVVSGIKVVRLWTYITANEGFIKRTLAYISFLVVTTAYIPFAAKADVVITTSPQFFNGLAGYLFSRLKRIPWILEIRDLWPESIFAVGAIKSRAIIRVLEWLEMFAYSHSDYIIPVTSAFRDYMLDKGIPQEKITVIKNGVDLSFYNFSDGSDVALPVELRSLQGKFVAAYVGTHGMAHHLETLLEAAELLRGEPEIVFLTVGEGSETQRLRRMCDNQNLHNVIMLGQMPKESMPSVWKIVDLSLVLLKKLDLFKTVIPSKIFESMAMKKPIVLGVQGESKAIIERAKSGIVIEPQNAKQLAESVKLFHADCKRYQLAAENGREFVSEFFDRKKLAHKYLEVIEAVIQKN